MLNKLLEHSKNFFGGGQDLNPRPCIFYALFIPTELSSRGLEHSISQEKLVMKKRNKSITKYLLSKFSYFFSLIIFITTLVLNFILSFFFP